MLASRRGTALRQSPHQDSPEEGSGEAKKTRKCGVVRTALGGIAASAEAGLEEGNRRGIGRDLRMEDEVKRDHAVAHTRLVSTQQRGARPASSLFLLPLPRKE